MRPSGGADEAGDRGPRVLVPLRLDAGTKPGGDVLHAVEAARAGARRGFRVRWTPDTDPGLQDVDLVHLWNLNRPHEAWWHARRAARAGIPYVLSPLHHDLGRYLREGRWRFRRGAPGPAVVDFERTRRRALALLDRRHGRLSRDGPGWDAERHELVRDAAVRLWVSDRERQDVLQELGLPADPPRDARVPTAIADRARADPAPLRARLGWAGPWVAVVGRVEDLKNPLAVVDALLDRPYPLVFAGAANRRHPATVARLLAAVARRPGTRWLGALDPDEVASLLAGARVHVLPSHAESVGRVTLEAALQGCALVSTTAGYAWELLGDRVHLCDPADPASIGRAVDCAWAMGPHPDSARLVREQYTWDVVGDALAEAWWRALGTAPGTGGKVRGGPGAPAGPAVGG